MNAFARAPSRAVLRAWGLALAVLSVILPALPLGPLFAQPPLPLAVLWAAYGWAAEDESGWRAPLTLAVLGLVHDQLAGGPYGLFAAIYLSAYLVGRVLAVLMSAPNLVSLWGGFIGTAIVTIGVAYVLARLGLGRNVSVLPYAEAAIITAIVFPVVRPLYMSSSPSLRPGGAPMKGKKVGSTLPKRDATVIFNRRATLMSFVGVGVLGAIMFRMGQLQATNLISQEYTNAADENRFDTRIIAPPRGIIYDRFGVVLAQTSKDYQVAVVQNDVENMEEVVGRVAQILGLDADWARRAIIRVRGGSRYEPQPLKDGLTWEQFNAINVRLPELRGIVAQSVDVRAYPYDVVYGHPIGYVQKPTQRDLDRVIETEGEGSSRATYLRNPHVRVGKAGLEASMEDVLHGTAGYRKVIVNARGVEQGEDENERREPMRGSGLVLTLDHDLQRIAMQNFGEQSGSAVVMDIHTGDMLVMASAPGFDPNLFVNGIGQREFDAYNLDEKKPLYHKTVTGVYAPGSTFKMIVGIAAKQAGLEDNWATSCGGGFFYGGRTFHCWNRHGRVNLHDAIKHSCDVYFYQAALRAGPERIASVARQFGLGQHFNVSVPNVRDGLIPDPVWWRENRNEGWTGGLTVNYGIGQGAMGVTPLQLAVMAARLGNNGYAVVPRLIREGPEIGDPPQAPHMTGISADHLARVRDGMYGVCNEPGGTAMRAGNLELVRHPETGAMVPLTPETRGWQPVQIAGKTGTAQVRALGNNRGRHWSTIEWRYRDNALFCCFGPWHEPRYACAVVVEHGGAGSGVAGPIAREIMRATLMRDPSRRTPARLAQLEENLARNA